MDNRCNEMVFHITDSTLITDVNIRQLTADAKTNCELSDYLVQKCNTHYKVKYNTIFIISGQNTMYANVGNFNNLKSSQEEAETKKYYCMRWMLCKTVLHNCIFLLMYWF